MYMKFKPRSLKSVVAGLKKLPYVQAVILFGSQARGTARQDSDIDIAVITKEITEKQESEIFGKGDDLYEVHPFSRLPLVIQFKVLAEGKTLFLKNRKMLHDTRVKVYRDYLDFAPALEKFCRSVIGHV